MQIGLIITNYFLLPVIMIFVGVLFLVAPPKYKNRFYGYRTPGSRKSPEAWEYAHRAMGMAWTILGLGMLLISFMVTIIYPASLTYELVTFGTKYCLFQTGVMILTIIPIEWLLHRK